jgi:hypothetical protein
MNGPFCHAYQPVTPLPERRGAGLGIFPYLRPVILQEEGSMCLGNRTGR